LEEKPIIVAETDFATSTWISPVRRLADFSADPRLLDEAELLSPCGVRTLSKYHEDRNGARPDRS